MHVHSAIGLQLLALPSTLILCFTSMLRERSIGDRDEKRLVRLYKQHAFVLELVQLFVTFMAFGFATGNTMAAFEARSLVIDYASEEVTRMIVRSALVRNAWLLGSAVCILACVNMLDSWSLPESVQDLTDPLFRLTRTLVGACEYTDLLSIRFYANAQHTDLGHNIRNDESQFFSCGGDAFEEDLERFSYSKTSAITHSLASLPTKNSTTNHSLAGLPVKKLTSESSDSDETITLPQTVGKTNTNDAPRPATRNNSKPFPPYVLDSVPRLHPATQNPTPSPLPSPFKHKTQPHYQDQTMSSSIRSAASFTSFSSLASSTSSISSVSSAKQQHQPSYEPSKPLKPALSRTSSLNKFPSRAEMITSNKSSEKTKVASRARKQRSVTFVTEPTTFPDIATGDGDGVGENGELANLPDGKSEEKEGDNDTAKAKEVVRDGVAPEKVRELGLQESTGSEVGLVELQHQHFHVHDRGVTSGGDGDGNYDDDYGDERDDEHSNESEEEMNVAGLGEDEAGYEDAENGAAMFGGAEEEEALVRKQRPNNRAQRDTGIDVKSR